MIKQDIIHSDDYWYHLSRIQYIYIYIYTHFLIKKVLTESIKGTIFQKDSTIVKISKDFVSPLYGSFALSAHLFRCIM